jgi:hypothetical protein
VPTSQRPSPSGVEARGRTHGPEDRPAALPERVPSSIRATAGGEQFGVGVEPLKRPVPGTNVTDDR